MNTPNTPRWKIWAAAAALFVAGLAVGSVITVAVVGRIVRKSLTAAANGQGQLVERGAYRLHARLVKDLSLDDAQTAGVRRTLDQTSTQLKALRGETRDELRRITRTTYLEIARQLTPTQRAEFRAKTRARLERFGLPAEAEGLTSEPTAP